MSDVEKVEVNVTDKAAQWIKIWSNSQSGQLQYSYRRRCKEGAKMASS